MNLPFPYLLNFFLIALLIALLIVPGPGLANQDLKQSIDDDYTRLESLYTHLHSHPELSFQEQQTSQRIAGELQKLGYRVTEGIGGFGIVAVMENGSGPTLMIRSDMDALPVVEKTGLPYASTVTAKNIQGDEVAVMHACGHDVHMTTMIGTATQMARLKNQWQGTLIFIAQPAEEVGGGAKAMLADGLFSKFPRPDTILAMHVSADLPAGTIGFHSGYAMANVDSVDIIVKGIGGHGAYPQHTKDPVIIAAQLILQLQTIISREVSPLDTAVITVGSIHGGSKHNIIGDKVKLQLTVRSYSDETREYLLRRIREISEGVARTAGLDDSLLPEVSIKDEYTPAVYNDPKLSKAVVNNLRGLLADKAIIEVPAVMAGEDFSRYGREEPQTPSLLLWLGSVPEYQYRIAKQAEQALPSLHSPLFAPDPRPTISTGVLAMTETALLILAKPEQ